MKKIPLPKNIFNDIKTISSLRSYCSDQKEIYDLPGAIEGLKAGERVILFCPGKYKDIKGYTELVIEIVSPEPVKIKIKEYRKPFGQ